VLKWPEQQELNFLLFAIIYRKKPHRQGLNTLLSDLDASPDTEEKARPVP